MTKSQHVVALFCEGKSIAQIYSKFCNPIDYLSVAEIEEILRKALRRHGRQKSKVKQHA